MGGSIAVTIREPSGNEHRLCEWTNPTPYFVNNPLLCAKDAAHIKKYLDGHERDKEDGLLAPIGYGLLLIDMQKDVILEMQGYTSYGVTNTAGLRNELTEIKQRRAAAKGERNGVSLNVGALEPDSKLASLRGFAAQGRVLGVARRHPTELFAPMVGQKFESIVSYILEEDRMACSEVVYDMAPFKVEGFQEDRAGAARMRERVLALGFKLSKKEERLWKEWRTD